MKDYALKDEYGTADASLDIELQWTELGGRQTCKRNRAHVTWSTVFGVRLWTMNQVVTWCWIGLTVTKVERNRFADVAGFFGNPWGFEGWTSTGSCNSETCSEKAPFRGLATIATQGKFQACAIKVAVCSTHNPYIEMQIGAQGFISLVKWIA